MAKIMGKKTFATESAAIKDGEKQGKKVIGVQKLPSGRYCWIAEDDNTSHFQNGAASAHMAIANKASKLGIANEMPVNQINKLIDEGKVDEAYALYMQDNSSYKEHVNKEQFLRMWKKHFQGDSW